MLTYGAHKVPHDLTAVPDRPTVPLVIQSTTAYSANGNTATYPNASAEFKHHKQPILLNVINVILKTHSLEHAG